MNTQTARSRIEQRKGQLHQIQFDLSKVDKDIAHFTTQRKYHELAQALFNEIAQETQGQIQHHLSDIVSMAMDVVFTDPYELEVEFVQRRNQTECDIYFVRDDVKVSPLSASGYGPVDVASFALRIASWAISNEKTQGVFILDEPFKHLKGEHENKQVLKMVKKISEILNLQIIMVSDERVSRDDIIENSDRVFLVGNKKGVSVVTRIGNDSD